MKLAPDCPNRDKAFRNVKEGKVLGIIFRSEDLSWSLLITRRKEIKMSKQYRYSSSWRSSEPDFCSETFGTTFRYLFNVSFYAGLQEASY